MHRAALDPSKHAEELANNPKISKIVGRPHTTNCHSLCQLLCLGHQQQFTSLEGERRINQWPRSIAFDCNRQPVILCFQSIHAPVEIAETFKHSRKFIAAALCSHQSSLTRLHPLPRARPWVETHGYHRAVATRPAFSESQRDSIIQPKGWPRSGLPWVNGPDSPTTLKELHP